MQCDRKKSLWEEKELRTSLFLAGLLHILLIKGLSEGGDYFIVHECSLPPSFPLIPSNLPTV